MNESNEVAVIFIKHFGRKSAEEFIKEVGLANINLSIVQEIFNDEDKDQDIGNSCTEQEYTTKWHVNRNAFQVKLRKYKVKFPLWVRILKGDGGIQ